MLGFGFEMSQPGLAVRALSDFIPCLHQKRKRERLDLGMRPGLKR